MAKMGAPFVAIGRLLKRFARSGTSGMTLSPEAGGFLQAIREDPENDEPRLIFADWLKDQGDPRGDYIHWECEHRQMEASHPRGRQLRRKAVALYERHRRQWLPRAPRYVDINEERGMVEVVGDLSGLAYPSVQSWMQEHRDWITRVDPGYLDGDNLSRLLSLSALPDICWLDLTSTEIEKNGFLQLIEAAPALRALVLDGSWEVTAEAIRHLTCNPNFRSLTLDFNLEEGAEHLPALTQLRALMIGYLSLSQLPPIFELCELERLEMGLRLEGKRTTLRSLASLRKLKSLTLYFHKVTASTLRALRQLPCLSHLDLSARELPNGIHSLAEMERLDDLSLKLTYWTQEDLTRISEMKLRKLRLRSLGDHLDFAGLEPLQSLEVLDLSESYLTDQQLQGVGQLTQIKDLDLSSNGLITASLKHLKPLKKLHSLNLYYNPIENDAIEILRELPALKWLTVQNTNMTRAGIQRLKKARPDLFVNG